MTIHEFGQENKDIIVMVHPSAVMWDYFEYVIPLLQDRYHLVIPALPGYDTENPSDFTGIEEIAAELADWLKSCGYSEIACIYGCSKDRKSDIAYTAKVFPQTVFKEFDNIGHGGLAALKPGLFAAELERVIRRADHCHHFG